MRNVDNDRAAEGPQPEDGTDGLYASAVSRRPRRRKQAMIGAAGLVAILGAGAVVAQQARDADTTVADVGALAPVVTSPPTSAPTTSSRAPAPASTSRSSASAAAAAQPAPPSPSAVAVVGASESPRTPEERVKAAREAAARDGVEVKRPLPEPTATVADADVKVTQVGSPKSETGTMRLVSARQDLTGQKELGWVADEGDPVGRVRCSSTIKLSNETQPKKRPTLLICWRTSATKSVYTVAVNLKERPSKQDSVAAIAKEWSRLG